MSGLEKRCATALAGIPAHTPNARAGMYNNAPKLCFMSIYCEDVATDATSFNFTIRDMISDHDVHKSRGRVIVYSYPRRRFTTFPIGSRQGFCCGDRL